MFAYPKRFEALVALVLVTGVAAGCDADRATATDAGGQRGMPSPASGATNAVFDRPASYGFREAGPGLHLSIAPSAASASVESAFDVLTVGGPGGAGNAFPFGGYFPGRVGTRYQQAYSATQFSTIGASLIRSIRFVGGGGTLAASNYTFSLSTITSGIDNLSNSNFDGNRGADNALFVSLPLSGTAPATLAIAGVVPFLYDPASGNLLLDIAVSPPALGGQPFTAFYASRGDATGIFSRYHNFGDGTVGIGLVTQFELARPTPDNLVAVIDEAIDGGTLTGTGHAFESWRKLIELAQRLAAKGNSAGACALLSQALERIDGAGAPPDRVAGSASGVIAQFIQATMNSLACKV